MSSPVHESIQLCFVSAIARAEASLPLSVCSYLVSNEEISGFGGRYSGSNKTPNLAVQIRDADKKLRTKLILEIGLSEKYEDLIQDARLWLEGKSEVSMCVLVNFVEEPRYRCPVQNIDKEEFDRLAFPDQSELTPEDIHLEDTFGPATYKGFVWVGRFPDAFLEWWTRDQETGMAMKYGDRVVSYLSLMRISLTDLYIVGSSCCSRYQIQAE
jgi:hypothetical protein